MKPKSMVPGSKSQQGSWSWLDRVQTKLESLYETEQGGSVFLQETGRMLESQVTKVGTNVKRFYSDFVRELLLPLEVPGETQAWVDAQARVKPPALSDSAAEGEKAPGGDKPGASSEGQKEGGVETPGEENVQQREGQAQAEVDGLASEISVSDSQDFEMLQPPLFHTPQVEETHEDLRVKERVTKLHLKLQEMERIETDKSSQAPAGIRSTMPEALENSPPPADLIQHPAPASSVMQARSDSPNSAADVPNAIVSGPTPVAGSPKSIETGLMSVVNGPKSSTDSPGSTAGGPSSVADAQLQPLDGTCEETAPRPLLRELSAAADSDAMDLELASEAEGEFGKREEEEVLSGNESDRSERAKWYGAKVALSRQGSGASTGEVAKGGWFDWELV